MDVDSHKRHREEGLTDPSGIPDTISSLDTGETSRNGNAVADTAEELTTDKGYAVPDVLSREVDIEPPPETVSDDVLALYFSRIGQVALLTQEEEVTLAKCMVDGKKAKERLEAQGNLDSELERELLAQVQAGEAARAYFIEANTRLVVSIAKRYRDYGLPFQDLIQAGNLGLIQAVDKFDHELGNRFSTYATWWIRQSIHRALTQQGYTIRLPYYLRSRIHRIRAMTRKLEKRLGREPIIEELAEALGEDDTQQLQRLIQIAQHTISLNTPVGDEEESELLNLIEDEDASSPADTVQDRLMREELETIMQSVLSQREIQVLSKRYGLYGEQRHTLQELADELELSRERVRQIERKALRKLRHPYHRRKLLVYLR